MIPLLANQDLTPIATQECFVYKLFNLGKQLHFGPDYMRVAGPLKGAGPGSQDRVCLRLHEEI